MKPNIQCIITLLFLLFFFTKCNSQESKSELINREPCVAGAFYEKNPEALRQNLKSLFAQNESKKGNKNVRAIIVPHAGYVFSGEVAASGFNQIDSKAKYDNVFIIGSSHKTSFKGASIYNTGNYKTPLGEVKVNIDLANKLVNENEVFKFYRDAHMFEHSLEVQLPFLQYHLENEFQIIPIVVGSQDLETPQLIATELLPYFNDRNLFIISSDFSHYPDYENAQKIDSITLNALLTGNPSDFVYALGKNEQKQIKNLATSCCGWTSVLSLLNLVELSKNVELEHIMYRNSGDTDFGDKNRVVGYHAIVGFETGERAEEQQQNIDFNLSKNDKQVLLSLARKTVEEHVKTKKVSSLSESDFSEKLQAQCGAFVTLHKHGNLRGCIGRFSGKQPLYNVIQEMAMAASTEDYRFQPVSPEEIEELEIEISVLTPMQKIESIDEIELGKHGIYIKKGFRSGTFLPQVATETGWSLEEFLGHCAKDKAGIGWEGWKDAEIYIYEAYVFSE
jgi:MEMO1 family protein